MVGFILQVLYISFHQWGTMFTWPNWSLGPLATACCTTSTLICAKGALFLCDQINSQSSLVDSGPPSYTPYLGPMVEEDLVWGTLISFGRPNWGATSLLPLFCKPSIESYAVLLTWLVSLQYLQNNSGLSDPLAPGDNFEGQDFPRNDLLTKPVVTWQADLVDFGWSAAICFTFRQLMAWLMPLVKFLGFSIFHSH